MAKEKNAGSYARGAAPRRSADRKADHARCPFLKENYYGCNYLHHQHWKYRAVCQAAGAENQASGVFPCRSKKRGFAGAKVVYLGWIMAGSVKGYAEAAKRYRVCAVCGVGMGQTGTQTKSGRKKSAIPANIPLFTLQGNFDVKKLHGIHRPMMEIMVKTAGKSLAKKKDRTPEENDMLDMMQCGGERVKAENLSAVLDWYSEQQ